VNNTLFFNFGLTPKASYSYAHSVLTRKDEPTEVHVNEVLEGIQGSPRYALATVIGVEGIRYRGFANPKVLHTLLDELRDNGYGIREFDTFKRTYMRFGDIQILLNESPVMYAPGLLGFMEAAVFESNQKSLSTFDQFVTSLGHKSALEMGGMAGPLTGAGVLAAVRLIHKAPPHVMDLSMPDRYKEMIQAATQNRPVNQ